MNVLFWGLVVLTWFPAGYLASRLANAVLGHDIVHGRWEKCQCTAFDWDRAVKTDSDQKLFALGFLFGWITVVFVLFFLVVGVFVGFMDEVVLKKLGELIAPKPKSE